MLSIRQSVTYLAEKGTVKGHKSSCHGSLSLCLMDKDNYYKAVRVNHMGRGLSIFTPYPSGQMRLLRMDLPDCEKLQDRKKADSLKDLGELFRTRWSSLEPRKKTVRQLGCSCWRRSRVGGSLN